MSNCRVELSCRKYCVTTVYSIWRIGLLNELKHHIAWLLEGKAYKKPIFFFPGVAMTRSSVCNSPGYVVRSINVLIVWLITPLCNGSGKGSPNSV